jgi:hypothetical protein
MQSLSGNLSSTIQRSDLIFIQLKTKPSMKENNQSPQQNTECNRPDLKLGVEQIVYKKTVRIFFTALLVLQVFSSHLVQAQIKYKANVHTLSGNRIMGQILRVTKDSLYLLEDNRNTLVIMDHEIETLRIKRKGAAGRGFIAGAATGIVIGGVIGYASYTPECSSGCWDFGPEYDALGGALVGFVAGSLLGTAIGGTGKEFKIEDGRVLEEAMTYLSITSSNNKIQKQ